MGPRRSALIAIVFLWTVVGLWRESSIRELRSVYEEMITAQPELAQYPARNFVYVAEDKLTRVWLKGGYRLAHLHGLSLYAIFALLTALLAIAEIRYIRGRKRV